MHSCDAGSDLIPMFFQGCIAAVGVIARSCSRHVDSLVNTAMRCGAHSRPRHARTLNGSLLSRQSEGGGLGAAPRRRVVLRSHDRRFLTRFERAKGMFSRVAERRDQRLKCGFGSGKT